MIGIYIHVPFCKQACHYCNFHFSTNQSRKSDFVKALLIEIELRKDELLNQEVASIYFGGGTPSLLPISELKDIFDALSKHFLISPNAEITLEANPDDINKEKLEDWQNLSINRISLGIQSFHSKALEWMNRAHSSSEALEALRLIQEVGFKNITADLIYGIPNISDEQWRSDILTLTKDKIPHISAYSLTVEENTALAYFVKKGTSPPILEEQANRQFNILIDTLEELGYEHYEISNFALPGMEAKHNSSYWLDRHYIGFGPSAHSYNGISRYWNEANNGKYIDALLSGKMPPKEIEMLTAAQKFNEYVLTRLRTHWGCNLHEMPEPFKSSFIQEVKTFVPEMVYESGGNYVLTRKGKMWADHISSQLFATETSE